MKDFHSHFSRSARSLVHVARTALAAGLLGGLALLRAADGPRLVLRSAAGIVQDQKTGEVLYQKATDQVLPIASLTKLVTAMVVLDSGANLQEGLTILEEDKDVLRHSKSHLPVGTRLTRREALLVALMASENRAAHALGRCHPGGLQTFVAAMNEKARALGLAATRFEDPAGLSSGNVSSARDLAKVVDTAWHYPLLREFSTRERAELPCGRHTREFHNTNMLLASSRWRIGLSKTGYIEESGQCLVMQAELARRPVLIVLLDANGTHSRFNDANRIRLWMEGPPPRLVRARGHKRR